MNTRRQDMPIISVILLVINAVVFFYQEATGDTESTMFLLEHGAMYLPSVIEQGEWYRVITHIFMHSGIEHLLCNMIMLVALGKYMEAVYGRINFIITYFLCGLGATFISALPQMLVEDYHVSVGASGAIMGLFGAYLVMLFKEGRVRGYNSAARLILLFIVMVFGNMEQGVDWMAHFGGAAFGVVIAFILYKPQGNNIYLGGDSNG